MISIVIPTLNESENLRRCLTSIRHQTYRDYEVIVSDSYSTDGTVAVARKYKAKVVKDRPKGAATAKNKGAAKARGEIFAFIDADAVLPPRYLERIAGHYKDKEVVAVAGPVRPASKCAKHQIMYYLTTNLAPSFTALFNFYQFQGANMSIRAETFKKMGGFKQSLEMLEDNEIGNRVKQYGKVIWDRGLYTTTSTRRFDKYGYTSVTFGFWKGYFQLYGEKKKHLDYKDRGGNLTKPRVKP